MLLLLALLIPSVLGQFVDEPLTPAPTLSPSRDPTRQPTETTANPTPFPTQFPTTRFDQSPTLDGGLRAANPDDVSDLFPYSPVGPVRLSSLLGRWYQVQGSLFLNPEAFCITVDWNLRPGGNLYVTVGQRLGGPAGNLQQITGTGTNAAYGIQPIPGILYGVYGSNIQQKSENLNPGIFTINAAGPVNVFTKRHAWVALSDPSKSMLIILARNVAEYEGEYQEEVLRFLRSNGFDKIWNKPYAVNQGGDCLYSGPNVFV